MRPVADVLTALRDAAGPGGGVDNGRVRLRVRFTKVGKVRFTSHRDVARIWERALRRVGLPVAYASGFTPRPRLSFGLALPTGYESLGEYLDIELRTDRYRSGEVMLVGHGDGTILEVAALRERLDAALPPGFGVDAVEPVEGKVESLQEAVTACTWRFGINDLDRDTAAAAVAGLLASSEVVVERERKGTTVVDDVRPAVHDMSVMAAASTSAAMPGLGLQATLAAKPRVVRPSELVSALAPGHEMTLAVRTHQWIERHGQRFEPLPPPPAGRRAPHTLRCAS